MRINLEDNVNLSVDKCKECKYSSGKAGAQLLRIGGPVRLAMGFAGGSSLSIDGPNEISGQRI
jgi:hypothetical protein